MSEKMAEELLEDRVMQVISPIATPPHLTSPSIFPLHATPWSTGRRTVPIHQRSMYVSIVRRY
ncbi:hypothetical protein E2C01_094904 [Portunus trituberculatus]|uniref:Uncharacterized protein n=1 Tax=Portunus trituberculatus TaxID=210409 RepID=A0A5B7K2X5_PORTR|nr:hypothetical protein [Portunus trituberculatus]